MSTHLTLVLGGGVTASLGRKLLLLQLGVGGHAALLVPAGQLKHAKVEGVEACQGHKLVLVAQLAQLLHIKAELVMIFISSPGLWLLGQEHGVGSCTGTGCSA